MDSLNPQYQQIGKEFVHHYYSLYNGRRNELAGLYKETSMMTFDSEQFIGRTQIIERLNKLPQTVMHTGIAIDIQPTPNNGILILVCGDIVIEENKPIPFCRIFHLLQSPNEGYFIFNDLFRLCIC